MFHKTEKQQMDGYNYYAFISYCRKDIKTAKRLQNKLEAYRLPSKLIKDHSELPKRINPVFRDKTDLTGITLEESIRKELEASKYLIVLCSPDSAKSKWVNKEIEYFKSLGREDRIIPVIIDGHAHSDNPDEVAFPEEIRKITPSLLGINLKEDGIRYAVLQIIATMLNIRYDTLYNRDKKRRIRHISIVATLVFLCLAMLSFAVYYNTPHSKYFSNVAFINEIPAGINKLSDKETENRSYSYKITTKQGRVTELQRVNSSDESINALLYLATTEYPVQKYKYDEHGKLISVSYLNTNNEVVYEKKLTYNKDGSELVAEFTNALNETRVKGLEGDISYLNLSTDSVAKSEITRQLSYFNEKGQITKTVYHRDNLGTPGCDKNGIYGKTYKYNESSQVTLVSNINSDGEVFNCKTGWAQIAYAYDENGNCISETYLDAEGNTVVNENGVAGLSVTFDKIGNITSYQFTDTNSEQCNSKKGFSKQICEYGTNGLITSFASFDSNNKPTSDKSGVHKTCIQYDNNGNQVCISFFDTEENPTYSTDYSCYSYKTVPDTYGRIVEASFLDADGNIIADAVTGAYGNKFRYDENGYLNEVTYTDETGKAFICSLGYATFRITRNSIGQILKEETFDANGKLISADGYAIASYEYDSFGNITKASYSDENNKPCNNSSGYSNVINEYEKSNLVSITYLSPDGAPTVNNDLYHQCVMTYENGNCVSYAYYDTEGKLTNTSADYAVFKREYDEVGNILKEMIFDKNQHPVSAPYVYLTKYEYDRYGNAVKVDSYFSSDTTKPFSTIVSTFDNYGNITSDTRYDGNGKLISNEANRYSKVIYEYDSKGNVTFTQYLDSDLLPLCHKQPGYPNIEELQYDDYGKIIRKATYHMFADGTTKKLFDTDNTDFLSEESNKNISFDAVFITEIADGTPADKFGIKLYDILLSYANWNFAPNDPMIYDNLSMALEEFAEKEKTVKIARNVNGSYKIFEYEFPAGKAGFVMESCYLTYDEVKAILTADK